MTTLGSVQTKHRPGLGRGARTLSSLPSYVPGLVVVCLVAGLALAWTSWARSPVADPVELVGRADPVLIDGLRADDTTLFAEANALYLDALAIDPDYPEALRGAAISDLGLHRFDLALDRATQATELRPDDHIAIAALVDANIELGRYEAAEESLETLLSVRPGLEAMSRLSYFRQLTGDMPGAIEAMYTARTNAAGLTLETARVNALVGEVEFAAGNFAAASEAYRLALAGDPTRLDAMAGEAAILFQMGKVSEAQAAVDEVLAIDSGDASALTLDAEIAMALGDTERARAATDMIGAAALAEHDAGYGIDPSAALAVSSWGDPALGLELATIIYEARPQNVRAAHAYAWALYQSGSTEAALAPLRVAMRFGSLDAAVQARSNEILSAGQ